MSTAERALCEDCGLCCDGTLFESVEIDGADERMIRPRRLAVVVTQDGSKLPLPCECLDGALCSVYERRPQRCRSFECELLRNAEQGRVTLADARGVIDDVRGRRRRVDAELPLGMAWWTALARLRKTAAPSALRDELVGLERLVKLRFWQ